MLLYDMDPTEILYTAPLGKITLEHINGYIDPVSEAHGVYLMCPGASRYITRIDSADFFLEALTENRGGKSLMEAYPGIYHLCQNLKTLEMQGIDLVQYVLSRAQQKGMRGYLTMRMSDVHASNDMNHPIHSSFVLQHPELQIPGNLPYENGLDFSHRQVRERAIRIISELVEKFDIDGFQLDWMRFPTYFPRGTGQKNKGMLTEIVEAARHIVSAKMSRTGRRIRLGVRVPGIPEAALERGMDVVRWSASGLVDFVVIAPFLRFDGNMPVKQWRASLPSSTALYYGSDIMFESYPGARMHYLNAQEIRGCAAAAFATGCNGVSLFNHFRPFLDAYPAMFREIDSIARFRGKSRRHLLGWHDNIVPVNTFSRLHEDETFAKEWLLERDSSVRQRVPLPLLLQKQHGGSFYMNTGLKPADKARVIVECAYQTPVISMELRVNGQLAAGNGTLFQIPSPCLRDGENDFTLISHERDAVLTDFSVDIN